MRPSLEHKIGRNSPAKMARKLPLLEPGLIMFCFLAILVLVTQVLTRSIINDSSDKYKALIRKSPKVSHNKELVLNNDLLEREPKARCHHDHDYLDDGTTLQEYSEMNCMKACFRMNRCSLYIYDDHQHNCYIKFSKKQPVYKHGTVACEIVNHEASSFLIKNGPHVKPDYNCYENRDYNDSGIYYELIESQNRCAEICYRMTECAVFIYQEQNRRCFIKFNKRHPVVKDGIVACEMNGHEEIEKLVQPEYTCYTDLDYQDTGISLEVRDELSCQNACYRMIHCKVFIYRPEDNMCFIKVNKVRPTTKEGVVSCEMHNHEFMKDIDSFLGISHWQGCYHVKTLRPFLLDGADSILEFGSKSIKTSVNFHAPWDDYPWNSPEWFSAYWRDWTPEPVEILKHRYYIDLFDLPFTTHALIVYSNVGRTYDNQAWRDPWYWVRNHPSTEQLLDEEAQFYNVARYLFERYKGSNKTFILQNWEGDWETRQYIPGAKTHETFVDVSVDVTASMIAWLTARQMGVSRAQDEFGANSNAKVYHAGEVNIVVHAVEEFKLNGRGDTSAMVDSVLPHVALDMVSYSAHDTFVNVASIGSNLWNTIDYIKTRHVRTNHSPPHAVYIGEIGQPQNTFLGTTEEWKIDSVFKFAFNIALEKNLPFMFIWQIYDNELSEKAKLQFKAEVCDKAFKQLKPHGLFKDPDYLQGFGLIDSSFKQTLAYDLLRTYKNTYINQSELEFEKLTHQLMNGVRTP